MINLFYKFTYYYKNIGLVCHSTHRNYTHPVHNCMISLNSISKSKIGRQMYKNVIHFLLIKTYIFHYSFNNNDRYFFYLFISITLYSVIFFKLL